MQLQINKFTSGVRVQSAFRPSHSGSFLAVGLPNISGGHCLAYKAAQPPGFYEISLAKNAI